MDSSSSEDKARARRGRHSNGARKKRQSRLAKLAALVIGPLLTATTQLSDAVWKDTGMWAIDTANTNCLESARDKVLPRSKADIQLLQETKVRTKQEAEAAVRGLRREGWNAHVPVAKTNDSGRGSGGCAVAARLGTGVTPVDADLILPEFRHRISAAHVSAVMKGGIHVISVYLKDSVGLTDYNLRVLQEVAALALTLGTPWIIAGDWNITPDQLQAANWLGVAKGTVFATELPTCHSNTYDYFVVSHNLTHAVVGVQRIGDAGLHPHHPCRLLLRGDAKRKAVRKLTRAPKIHATLPHGPAPKPPDYDKIFSLGS